MKEKKIYTASVGVTGRCNLNCTYCHYYKSHSRKLFAYDISDKQFIDYMNFLKFWNHNIEGELSYRFSGGEPTVLGDRLFDLANIGFDITGEKPFVLTAGKDLSEEWVKKAKDSSISHVFVSIENPVNPDSGAVDPKETVKKIQRFHSEEMPIVPGVCVVPNNCFKYLHKICKWFLDELGSIPLICEVNYDSYETPSKKEWRDFTENISLVIQDFFPLFQLNLFSSIVPEYAYGGRDPYLFELNLENSYSINSKNVEQKSKEILNYISIGSYPKLSCKQTNCTWFEFCNNTKWYWQKDPNLTRVRKLQDYCKFKRIISDSFYKILVDSNHQDTKCSLSLV